MALGVVNGGSSSSGSTPNGDGNAIPQPFHNGANGHGQNGANGQSREASKETLSPATLRDDSPTIEIPVRASTSASPPSQSPATPSTESASFTAINLLARSPPVYTFYPGSPRSPTLVSGASTPSDSSVSGTPPPASIPDTSSAKAKPTPVGPRNAPNGSLKCRLCDREERAIANMLSRFRKLVQLAAMQNDAGDSATQEVAAAQAFELEVETAALVRGAEDLLQLSRELKELWLFGPLRGIGEGEGEAKIDKDAEKVGEILEAKLRADADQSGSGSSSGAKA